MQSLIGIDASIDDKIWCVFIVQERYIIFVPLDFMLELTLIIILNRICVMLNFTKYISSMNVTYTDGLVSRSFHIWIKKNVIKYINKKYFKTHLTNLHMLYLYVDIKT